MSQPNLISASPPPPASREHKSHLTLSRRGLCILIAVLVLPWAAMGLLSRPRAAKAPAPPAPAVAAQASGIGQPCRPGPWGQVTTVELLLEPPEEYVQTGWDGALTSVWHFAGMKESEVVDVLQQAGLPAAQHQALADRQNWRISPAGVDLYPPDAVLLAMPPQPRERLYSRLAALPGNAVQTTPYTFLPGQFEDQVASSNVSTGTVAMVEHMLYRRGSVLLLSDMYAALNALSNRAERLALVQSVARMRTLMLRLRVDGSSDIEGLVAYWGKGGRAKSLRPLLAAMSRVPGGCDIDIVNLLPDFARRRLNTFPTPDPLGDGAGHDCYWSAINFFSENTLIPPPEFGHLNELIRKSYFQLPGEPTFGDLLFLVLPSGESIHAAVYIADGIVFTKNGGFSQQPWMLMRMDDLALAYGGNRVQQEPISVLAWRRTDF